MNTAQMRVYLSPPGTRRGGGDRLLRRIPAHKRAEGAPCGRWRTGTSFPAPRRPPSGIAVKRPILPLCGSWPLVAPPLGQNDCGKGLPTPHRRSGAAGRPQSGAGAYCPLPPTLWQLHGGLRRSVAPAGCRTAQIVYERLVRVRQRPRGARAHSDERPRVADLITGPHSSHAPTEIGSRPRAAAHLQIGFWRPRRAAC